MHTNYNIFVQAESNSDINEHYKYLMHDADGTKHWFYFETSSATTAKDEDGLGYTLDIITVGSDSNCTSARYRITDKDKNKMYFNSDGYLIKILEIHGIANTITYTGNKILTVTDGAGRVYTYSYSNGYCDKITDPAGRETSFSYSAGCLTSITFPDGKSISLVHTYSSVYMLNKIYDIDGMKFNIAYDWTSAFRVSSISYGNESTGQLLSRYAFTYKQNETKVQEQYRTNSSSPIVTTETYAYQFNNWGQNTGIVAEKDGKAQYWTYNNSGTTNSATSAKNNKVSSQSKIKSSVNNLIKSHNFQSGSLSDYQVYMTNSATGTIDTSVKNLDRNSIKLTNTNSNGHVLVTQEFSGLSAGYYTFSAYVKTSGVTGDGVNIGLKSYNGNSANDAYVYSESVNSTDGWERISVSINVPSGYSFKIILGIRENSIGTAWFDNLQLEKGVSVSSYNMLENPCFNYSNTRWTQDTTVENVTGLGDITKALKRTANLSENNNSSQVLRAKWLGISQFVYTSGSKGDIFNIGAWIKANSAPINDLKTGDTYIPRFALALHFYNGNNDAVSSEVKVNPYVSTWQFVSGQAVAPCNYDKVCYEIIYYSNVNSVYITGGFCHKESSTDNYDYDSNGNLISVVDLANTNSQFDYKNNNLVTMLNPSGSNYLYFYNGTRDVDTAFSTDGLKYYITYDSKGNPTSTNTKGVKFATSVNTSKKYAIFNQLTSNALDKNNSSELINYRYSNNSNSQQWTFESVSNGVYKMKLGNYYLRVKDTSAGNGAKLELVSSSDNSSRYLFTVTPTTDGAFTISNTSTGATRYLDSTNGSTQTAEDGSYVTLRNQPTRNSCQKWYFVEDYTDEVLAGRRIVTSATYTSNQNFIRTQTDQAGNTTTYNYNITNGTLTSVENATGVETSYTYNSNNNALQSVSSDDMTNSYAYSNDRLTDINVNNGTKYKFEYDGFGRTTSTKVGNGTTYNTLASLTYNERNLLSRQTYGNGDYINYTYDSFDRVTEKSYNSNEQYKKHYYYGNDGNISVTTDSATGSYTRYVYDSVGRVVSTREYSGLNINGNSPISYTNYTYAPKTNYLTKEKFFSPLGTQNIEFVYGQMTSGQMPDQVYSVKWNGSTKLTNSFDHLARLSKRTINGLDTDYTYIDRDNNLTTTLVDSITTGGSNGVTHTYTYDALGNITSVYDGSHTTSYEYDTLNQLVRVNDPYENRTHVYTYVNGNITADTVYAYTTSETLSNPLSEIQYEYTNTTWADVLTAVDYCHYENSRSENENSADAATNSLAERLFDRRYDVVDMSSALFGNNTNRDAVIDDTYAITSDSIGNITGYSGITFNWLGRQLQSLSDGTTPVVTYSYNADGQRIGKNTAIPGEDSYNYTYYYNGETLAGYTLVITASDNTTQTYNVTFMYDDKGEPFGFSFGGNDYYYVRNAQNDIYLILDSNNQAVVLYEYDAWGNITHCYDISNNDIVSTLNPYTYRGYFRDNETGSYYLKSRYYFPEFHRFICADGLVQTGQGMLDKNMFAYCGNNPVSRIDPSGLFWNEICDFLKTVVNEIVNTIGVLTPAYAGCGGAALSDGPLPFGDMVGAVGAVLLTVGAIVYGTYQATSSRSVAIPKAEEREKTVPAPPKMPTVIYRFGGGNPGNLTPRAKDVYTGLSFSTVPKPGANVVTTIEAINATGVVKAIQDRPGHVSVVPVGATVKDWIDAGPNSIWTQAVSSVVIKWDGK